MQNIHILTWVFLMVLSPFTLKSQVNVSKYMWEYPLQQRLTVDAGLKATLQEEMQKVIDNGNLFFRPLTCRYGDQVYENYFLYTEPGKILQTIALAYPYLTGAQQSALRSMVPALLASNIHAPWSGNPLGCDKGARRELYEAGTLWGLNAGFASYRPTIQGVYSIWLYLYRTGDTSAVQPYYSAIKSFYDNKFGAGIDPGNLYGTMCSHIGMARLAAIFNDAAQVNTATGRLSACLENGLDIHYVDSMAFYGKQGWNAPYGNEYDSRKDDWTYRGYIFLNLSPEMGRYLKDTLFTEVSQRHNQGLARYPLWWLMQSPYFTRWTADESIGIPSEAFGMIAPVERWIIHRDAATMKSYLQSSPTGIADCYWLEAVVYAIESDATDIWVDVRTTPFSTDSIKTIPAIVSLDMIISAGADTCFGATQTIVAAGDGKIFTVQGTGHVVLEAGSNVMLKEGTTVANEGYLRARIITDGNYCTQHATIPAIVSKTEFLSTDNYITTDVRRWCRVYPVPTTGKFTLEVEMSPALTAVTVGIYSMLGECLLLNRLTGRSTYEIDISGRPGGVYIVRVTNGTGLAVLKVVKE